MRIYEVITTSGLYGPDKHVLVLAKSYADAEKAVLASDEAFACGHRQRIISIAERSEMVIITLPKAEEDRDA